MSYAKNRRKKERRFYGMNAEQMAEARKFRNMIRKGILPRWHNTVEMVRRRGIAGFESLGWKRGSFRIVGTYQTLVRPVRAPRREPGFFERVGNAIKGKVAEAQA